MNSFCADTAGIWGLLGYVVLVLKIVIPLILIVLGMIDLGSAVVSSDDKAINGAVNKLLHRFIAAVIVFFVPTIVSALFNVINVGNDVRNTPDYQICIQCLTNVGGQADGYCKSSVDTSGEITNTTSEKGVNKNSLNDETNSNSNQSNNTGTIQKPGNTNSNNSSNKNVNTNEVQ